jgi:hypothetical protein
VADAERLYLVGYTRIYGLVERRGKTARKLSAVSALRALREAGFRHLKIVGTKPLTIRVGKDDHRSRRNVCHIAVFGAEANVERGWNVLREVCG